MRSFLFGLVGIAASSTLSYWLALMLAFTVTFVMVYRRCRIEYAREHQ